MHTNEIKRIERFFTEGIGKPLSAQEACEFLGISLSLLYKMTCRMEIPFHKPRGKIYFLKSELAKWLMKNPKAVKSDFLEKDKNA